MAVQFFKTASSFLNFDGPNTFFPKFNGPLAPDFRKEEKNPLSMLWENGKLSEC